MVTSSWDLEGYWNAVLGTGTADEIVLEHDLVDDMEEWLIDAESTAWAEGGEGGEVPPEWAGFRAKALVMLRAAL